MRLKPPGRRFAPCVGRRLMSPCSGKHIVYPLSALISEPWHGQADGAHVRARGGPPQCASTFGAGLLWPVLCAPVRKGGHQGGWGCPGSGSEHHAPGVRGDQWASVTSIASTFADGRSPGPRIARSSSRNSLLRERLKLAKC